MPHSTPSAESSEPPAAPIDLAMLQAELALDRTQLAWIRTGFAFMTAGFALDQGTQALHQARILKGSNWVETGHVGGVLLTMLATLFLSAATLDYFRQTALLARERGARGGKVQLAGLMSVLMIALGLFLAVVLLSWD